MEEAIMQIRDVKVEMPFRVEDFQSLPGQLYETFGKAEPEIAAAVLLRYSIEAGRWVGISVDDLVFRMQMAQSDRRRYDEAVENLRKWTFLSKTTRGVYGAFCLKPKIPETPEDPLGSPDISAFTWIGFFYLANSDLVKIEEDFVYPTPALINRVAEKWKKT